MKRLIICTAIFIFCNIHLSFAQPDISIEQIPPNTPADVREQITRLYSKDPVQRFLGAYELGKLGPKAATAIEFLVGILDDDTKLDGDRIFQIYYGIQPPLYVQAPPPTSPGERAAWSLVQIGPVSVQPLIHALKNKSPHARINAIKALRGLKSGVMDIATLLKDEAPEVRLCAVIALAEFKDPNTVPFLIDVLSDPATKVRLETISALSHQLKDGRAIMPIYDLINNENEEVKNAAISGFVNFIDNPLASDLVRKGIENKEPRAFDVIVFGNWLIRKPELVDLLIPLLKDENPRIRAAATTALRYNYENHQAAEPLILLLKDSDPTIRARAVSSLAEMNDWRAVEPLIAIFNKEPSILVADALGKLHDPKAVEPLLVVLKNTKADKQLRYAIADALGGIKDIRAVEQLLYILNYDSDNFLTDRAFVALTQIAGRYFGSPQECIDWWKANKAIFNYSHSGRAAHPTANEILRYSSDNKMFALTVMNSGSIEIYNSTDELLIKRVYNLNVYPHDWTADSNYFVYELYKTNDTGAMTSLAVDFYSKNDNNIFSLDEFLGAGLKIVIIRKFESPDVVSIEIANAQPPYNRFIKEVKLSEVVRQIPPK